MVSRYFPPFRCRRSANWDGSSVCARKCGVPAGSSIFRFAWANAVRFELPLAPTGEFAYTISIRHHGRAIGAFILLAAVLAYMLDSFFPALFIAVVGSGLIGIGLHYAMRKSVVRYLGLLPSQYAEHRLSMG